MFAFFCGSRFKDGLVACKVLARILTPRTRCPAVAWLSRFCPKMATQTQVAEVTDWVARHGFERVALQFPDAMLADAVGFVKAAREALPQAGMARAEFLSLR